MQNKKQAVVTESPFFKMVCDESVRRTYVVFSSVDIEPGKFMFWRVMQPIAGTKIFLNDDKNGWYVHGIPTLGDSVPDAAASLLNLIKATDPEEVVFLGPSMGGYAAMLYGALLKPDLPGIKVRCLSFGGEFLLYGRESRSKAFTKKTHNQAYADLRPFLKKSNLSVTHVYGDSDINDIYQASLVEDNVKVRRVAIVNGPHAISTFIGERAGLIEFIRVFGELGSFPDFQTSNISLVNGFAANLFKGHLALVDGDKQEALLCLEVAARLCESHAVARHKYGIALFQVGRLQEAFIEQVEAVRLNPDLDNAHYHLGILLKEQGSFAEASLAFENCCRLNPLHVASRFVLANEALEKNASGKARSFLEEILKVDKNNIRAREMLLRVIDAPFKISNGDGSIDTAENQMCRWQSNELFNNVLSNSLLKLKALELDVIRPSQGECELLLQKESRACNWVGVVGVGRFMVRKWPMKYRGYISQFDGLLNLGLRHKAKKILEMAVEVVGRAPLITQRQMRLYNYAARWDVALDVFKLDVNAKTDEKCINEAFLAAQQMKDLDLASWVVDVSKFSDKLFVSLSMELARQREEWSDVFFGLTRLLESKPKNLIAHIVASDNNLFKELACWKLYRDGFRDEGFFDFACNSFPQEEECNRRVFFFRIAAVAAHPRNFKYIELLVCSYVNFKLFDEVSILLDALSSEESVAAVTKEQSEEFVELICNMRLQVGLVNAQII